MAWRTRLLAIIASPFYLKLMAGRFSGGRVLVDCLVVAGLAASTPAASAQELASSSTGQSLPRFVHEVWTVEDGLPVNSINALVQSPDGYIWAATFDGLVRFDGVRFTVYTTEGTEGLPSNRIIALAAHRDGSLWLRTEQGHLVHLLDGVFTHVDTEVGLSSQALTVADGGDGTAWIGTEDGMSMFVDGRLVDVAPETLTEPVQTIAPADDGGFWLGTANGTVFRYADSVVTEAIPAERRLRGSVRSFHDVDGLLWIGTSANLYWFDGNTVDSISSPDWDVPNSVWGVLASPSGDDVWVHSSNGVYRVRDGRVSQIAPRAQQAQRPVLAQADGSGRVWLASGQIVFLDGEQVYSLRSGERDERTPATDIRALLRDHEGSIWLGTNSAGLHRLKPALFRVFGEEEGLGFRNVYSVSEGRSGTYWFGTWGAGLSRLRDGVVTNFVGEGYPAFVMSIVEDRAGRLWLGTYAYDVWSCSLPAVACARWNPPLSPTPHAPAIYEDREGSIWFGTSLGVYRLPAGSQDRELIDGEENGPVRVFLETHDGAVWMGTNGRGLLRYDAGTLTHVTSADGLPSDLVRSLHQDEDGALWIGTEGRGLARLDPAAWGVAGDRPRSIDTIGTNDGLFDAVIHQILEDDDRRLWMSTNRGIFWVSRDELNAFIDGDILLIHSTAYTERDGLRNREANGGAQPAGIKASDGRLWFATQNGAVVVDPSDVQRNSIRPPVVVEQVAVANRSVRAGSDIISLDPHERDLQIDYTALSFLAPENVRFRYRLEGYDDAWVEAGNRRSAFYTQVPPGEYTFRVNASSGGGVWNETGAAVGLSIAPFFYETRTYYAVLTAALVLLVVLGVRWRVRSLETKQKELSQLVDARTAQLREHEKQLELQNAQLEAQATKLEEHDRTKSRFFANVSHEFRTPLTLTIGPLEDLRREAGESIGVDAAADLDLALRNARRLLRLVNQVLDVSKLEAGQLEPNLEVEDIVALVNGIGESFVPLAERSGINFRISVPEDRVMCAIDADMIEKAIANLLSNAFKFTPENGSVRLSLEVLRQSDATEEIVIVVRDSGPGINEDDVTRVFDRFYQASDRQATATGTGIGLSLAREFVELHGGRITVESQVGFGSAFSIHLPKPPSVPTPMETQPDRPAREVARGVIEATTTFVRPITPPVDAGDDREGDSDRTTVLVVEDNVEVRTYVTKNLRAKYRVLEAANGREGLEVARSELPDVVISDLLMPEMDGLELCAALKEDVALHFVPFILLTAKAEMNDKLEGLEGGADEYITKPFEFAELELRIRNLVATRKRLTERARSDAKLLPRPIDVPSSGDELLDRVRDAVEEHFADEDFDVERLAMVLGCSRSSLYRDLEAVVDQSPAEIIQSFRLERASQLLEAQAGTVSEVAYGVGFKSVSHFSRRFRQRFGVTPSDFMNERLAPPRVSPPTTRPT